MLRFTGDINLTDNAFDIGFGVGSSIAKGEIQPFSKLPKRENDLWVGNFEGVVADVSNRNGYTREVFRISSDVFDKCGSIIDYWGLANNHVMEHGEEAFLQMEKLLSEKGKGTFGSNVHRSVEFVHCGKKIAITGYSLRVEEKSNNPLYWHLPELFDLQEEVGKIANADYKIAYIHWGVEYVDHPSVDQIKHAHWLIDIGYDLVIGMHPHVRQGYEVYKGKHIFYSLGNTIFNMNHEPSRYSAVVSLDVLTGNVSYHNIWVNDTYCPVPIDESEVPESYKFSTLNPKINKEQNIEKYIGEFHHGLKAFRKSNYKDVFKNVFRFRISVFVQIMKDFVKRKIS